MMRDVTMPSSNAVMRLSSMEGGKYLDQGTGPSRDETLDSGKYEMPSKRTDYGSVDIEYVESRESSGCLCFPGWARVEFSVLFNLAWTMVIATILTNLLPPIGLMFAGHLGIDELGGVALGNTVVNIFGNAVGIGLSTACDTFFAQTFGSGNKSLMGVYLQRGCYIILLFTFPCWMILINTETVLVALGQEPVIAHISAEYIFNYLPVIPLVFLYHIFSKYLRNQNIIIPTLLAGGFGVGVTALSAWLFVNVLDLRVAGCAYAQILGFFVFAGGCVGYSVFSPNCRQCWDGFTWDALQDWGSFTNLAIYGMLLVLEQIGTFEAGTILAGLLGKVELAAQTILFQIEIITFMVPIGVGIACNIRIGHLLGANDAVQTRRSVRVGWAIIWCTTALVAVLLALLRYQIPRLFTDDEEVINLSAQLLLIMALYAVFEGTVGTSAGMLRGCGRQRYAAYIAFLGYFVIGLPIGVGLMFYTELRLAGFWWGITVGIIVQAFFYVAVLVLTDWEKQAADAQLRAGMLRESNLNVTEDDETAALLLSNGPDATKGIRPSSSRLTTSSQRLYCGEFDSSLPNVTVVDKPTTKLSKREMICRRGFAVFTCLLLLAVGFVVRFIFPPAPIWTDINGSSTSSPIN